MYQFDKPIERTSPSSTDFSNGLFLTAANFGTAMGTSLCGILISLMIRAPHSLPPAFF